MDKLPHSAGSVRVPALLRAGEELCALHRRLLLRWQPRQPGTVPAQLTGVCRHKRVWRVSVQRDL
jgi:hypothetical protein